MNEEDRKILEYFVSSYDFHYKHFKTRPTLLPREKEAMKNMLRENKELKAQVNETKKDSDKWFRKLQEETEKFIKINDKKDKTIKILIECLAEERGTDEDEVREVFGISEEEWKKMQEKIFPVGTILILKKGSVFPVGQWEHIEGDYYKRIV